MKMETDVKKIINWSARRAGAKITITGETANGKPIKIVGVETIEAGKNGGNPMAIDMSDERYELA